VVRAEEPLKVGHDLLLQRDGIAGAPGRPVRVGQVAAGSRGVGVVRAEEPLCVTSQAQNE